MKRNQEEKDEDTDKTTRSGQNVEVRKHGSEGNYLNLCPGWWGG